MGSAIFFDLVKDKTIDGFHPDNVVSFMTSPLSGTLVPGASARTEVQGIGVQSYPVGWFTRSNFGGRFSSMLKFAGWDGVVIAGRSDKPVWIDIRNDNVKIQDCRTLSLWGTETWACQEAIWHFVAGGHRYSDWFRPEGKDGGRSTQRPAVVSIGPAGENLSRAACLIHDASAAAGQGGFGAVLGAKNLKAISVIGTGHVHINDAKLLIETRLWQKKNYAFDLSRLKRTWGAFEFQAPPAPVALWRRGRPRVDQRPQACTGCHSACRARYADGLGNEASCFATVFYWDAKNLDVQRKASDFINRYGLNAVDMIFGLMYIRLLEQGGLLQSADIPACPLDFKQYGSEKFVEQFVKMMAYGNDGSGGESAFGKDLLQGFVRAAKKWGRMDEDLASGLLAFPYWGIPVHKEPRAQVDWSFGTILGDRDINEHDFDWLKHDAAASKRYGFKTMATAEEAVKIITDKMVPYQGDMKMLDFSEENLYSEHIVKLVSWHRYHTRFWKQSMLFCDVRWPDFLNMHAPGKIGSTGVAEPKYYKAVTGKDLSFAGGMELGRKIWNLDHAIWTLQGRHRDMVHFADALYNHKPLWDVDGKPYLPGIENGQWDYHNYGNRTLNKKKFDEFKTLFYKFQGWDPETGYPKKATLKELGLESVADELQKRGKLGKA